MRHKPRGWPKLMVAKRLKSGFVGYYWAPPTWALMAGCPCLRQALGTDYGEAKRQCDDVLNPQFDAWRLDSVSTTLTSQVRSGSFDWMVSLFRTSPKYRDREMKTRKSYDSVLRLVSEHTLKDGRKFGSIPLSSITPGVADRLFEKLRTNSAGRERVRTAVLCMRVCQRAWNVARRDRPDLVPLANPFAKMGLSYKPRSTRPVGFDELMRFVEGSDGAGESSIGTAAMIAFFWLQRQEDILKRLTWSHYQPADAPGMVRIFHHKTRELVELPLFDEDGTRLWPELMDRLEATARTGLLIVMRDQPDRRQKIYLPWKEDHFRHRAAAIRAQAGISNDAKFMGLRHGGNIEGAEANLTDAQLRALSGHKTTAAMLRYAQATEKQRRVAARKRLDSRTKRDNLSE